jgi:hypothetical protein
MDQVARVCRNIRTLLDFESRVNDDEILAASWQYVRKVSGFSKPSKVNEAAFFAAVDRMAAASRDILNWIETNVATTLSRLESLHGARVRRLKVSSVGA